MRADSQGPAWAGSDRRDTLPSNWKTIRRRILDRDNYRCTWVDNGNRCTQVANQVDHMGDRSDHRDSVLRSLCAWHHGKVSSAQGNAARWRFTMRRPDERHPGML